jgi:hypothetical protein
MQAAAGGGASSSQAAAAQSEILAILRAPPGMTEVWLDGKPRPARVTLTQPDEQAVSVVFEDAGKARKSSDDFVVQRGVIRGVLLGPPIGLKKKMLGRNPRPERCVTLEDGEGRSLLHIEVGSDAQRQRLATALAAFSGAPVRVAA